MSARRIMVPDADLGASEIVLSGEPLRHVSKVLRLGVDAELLLLDGRGNRARAVIRGLSPTEARLLLTDREAVPRSSLPPLHLLQALPKGRGKMDEIVRRATELGAASIAPASSQRSVARPDDGRAESRLERWRKIAVEASRQCRRDFLPEILDLRPLPEALERFRGSAPGVMLWEEEGSSGFASHLEEVSTARGVVIVIGPEGGFTAGEAQEAREMGYATASLGPLVLRTETAAIAACTLAQHYLGGLAPQSDPD